ncbi:MAG: arylsulfatase [Verrucomicrobiota bacterium]
MRVFFVVLFGFYLLGFSVPGASGEERPNILVILVDDMGYSDLGCYGSEIETPNLDALAGDGIRFTQMYNTSKCWPTRISLLTGVYHHRTDREFAGTATAGEVLRPAGYRTWWSGKHHANFNPAGRGFDHFSGFLGGAINFWNPSDVAREGESEPGWRAVYTWAFDEEEVKPFVPDTDFYATDVFTDWALEWLDEERSVDEPFFLYVAYNAPHWPLHARAEDIAKYEGVYDEGYGAMREARYARQLEMGLFDETVAPLSEATHVAWLDLSEEERRVEAKRMEIHAAMVDSVDQNVGRLVEKLRETGELENTLILFLVDNGASAERPNSKGAPMEPWGSVGTFEAIGKYWANVANTPLRLQKAKSHEGGINTPMIAHWPAGISGRGEICREVCHLIDFLPTFMEMGGANYPGEATGGEGILEIDGISLVPVFSGGSLERTGPLFFEFGGGKAVRDGKWKLVRQGNDPWELYDFSVDRTETHDLAEEHPERVEQMVEAWGAWYRDCTGSGYVDPRAKKKGT